MKLKPKVLDKIIQDLIKETTYYPEMDTEFCIHLTNKLAVSVKVSSIDYDVSNWDEVDREYASAEE